MGWKWPLIVLSVLGLLGLAGWGISLRLDAVLDSNLQECLEIQERFPVDPTPRAAILGPEEEGRIWELLGPAFAGLEALDPHPESDVNPSMAPNFDVNATPDDLPRVLEAARPYLELCRRAACRKDAAWTGSRVLDPSNKADRAGARMSANRTRDPDSVLPGKAGRAVRACCSKALLLWRERRDAEAVEWLVVALAVAYDSVKLTGNWTLLEIAERWALQDFRSILGAQDLTAPQLEELGRRLELLRRARPSFIPRLRIADSIQRLELLEEDVYLVEEDAAGGDAAPLSLRVGWRDFWSLRYARVRILNDLRRCRLELEAIPWQDPGAAVLEAESLMSAYQGRYVRPFLCGLRPFGAQESELMALDVLSVAVGCARFQAAQGRLPRTWAESGITLRVTRLIDLEEGGIFLPSLLSSPSISLASEWRIGRRSGKK